MPPRWLCLWSTAPVTACPSEEYRETQIKSPAPMEKATGLRMNRDSLHHLIVTRGGKVVLHGSSPASV